MSRKKKIIFLSLFFLFQKISLQGIQSNVVIFRLVSRTYSNVLNKHKIKIKFPEKLRGKKINEVKIIPCYGVKYFKIAYCCKVEEEKLKCSKFGKLLNADVNGAADILRKSKKRLDFERLCFGFLDNPLRIRLS